MLCTAHDCIYKASAELYILSTAGDGILANNTEQHSNLWYEVCHYPEATEPHRLSASNHIQSLSIALCRIGFTKQEIAKVLSPVLRCSGTYCFL